MFKSILRKRPVEAKSIQVESMEEFFELARSANASVTVGLVSSIVDGSDTWSGVVGTSRYALRYTTDTVTGRKVVYTEPVFKKFGSERGLLSVRDRRSVAILQYLHAEKAVKRLEGAGLRVSLVGPDGRPMDEQMSASLHRDAAARGISL